MSSKIIILKTFMFPQEAYPLMSKLENEGIKCFLDGENTVLANPLLSNAVGGVKLKISDTDLQKAVEIVQESEKNLPTGKKSNENNDSLPKGYEKNKTYCIKCESTNVYRKKIFWNSTILALLFFPVYLLLKILKKKYYCADCGQIWKQ